MHVYYILAYKDHIEKWFNVLMPKIDRFLYGNGGNIIMVQVQKTISLLYILNLIN